jgi:hypothetical protein
MNKNDFVPYQDFTHCFIQFSIEWLDASSFYKNEADHCQHLIENQYVIVKALLSPSKRRQSAGIQQNQSRSA